MAQTAHQPTPSFRNRQRPRPRSRGVVINLKIDSRDQDEREIFAHAPISASAAPKQKAAASTGAATPQTDQTPTDFDEPASLPQEDTGIEDRDGKRGKRKGSLQEGARALEQEDAEGDEAYRPFSKTGEEEDEFEQQKSEEDKEQDQREGGESGEEQKRQQSDQQRRGHAAGPADAQNVQSVSDQSAADRDRAQKSRQSHQQKAAAAKAEAEKKAASAAAELLGKKLNPQFLATKELVLWCWRTVIISFGLTLVAISFYYLTIFCFHPPGWCEPGEEFDIPGDKTWRNTLFTVGVLFLTLIAIGILGALLVLIIFLSMCPTPAGFLVNWSQCLEAFRVSVGK